MNQLQLFLKSIRDWPIVQPVLDLLGRERVMVLLLALLAYYVIPSMPNLSPLWAERLSGLVFYGGGIILLGLSAESLIETKAGLPLTLAGIGTELIQAATSPTVTTTTTVAPGDGAVLLSATPPKPLPDMPGAVG